jgi:hypothetical protein
MDHFIDTDAFRDDGIPPNNYFFDVESMVLNVDPLLDDAIGLPNFEKTCMFGNVGSDKSIESHGR